MKVLNLGSLNVDRVYTVDSFVKPGQTVTAGNYELFCGGKGLNQSVALARAGAEVLHLGRIGPDGGELKNMLVESGANTDYLRESAEGCGHAVIQVDSSGENCIVVWGGANQLVTEQDVNDAVDALSSEDFMLTQNETSSVPYAIYAAKKKGVKVVLNPSPITEELLQGPLDMVDMFILNETEGAMLSGVEGTYQQILQALGKKYPNAEFVLTVGAEGSYYHKGDITIHQSAFKTDPVDTTGAGDTFCGYYLAAVTRGYSPQDALKAASKAASIAVGRKGAAPSIPKWEEVMACLG